MTARYLTFILFLTAHSSAFGAETPKFSLPLDCQKGPTCFLQNMMDMAPGPERRDPLCGAATYNGHKGTDIRVRTLSEMHQKIPVLAMADGKVLRLRNDAADRLIETKKDYEAVKGVECGNGVVIDHGVVDGNRWISQSCHLAKGSIPVKPGQRIKRGQKIGTIGISGSTQFPHIHVTLRKNGKLVDLLTGSEPGQKCAGEISPNLLSKKAVLQLKAMQNPLLLSGFSSQPVTRSRLIRGKTKLPTIGSPLIFYAHYMNLKKGDRIGLVIKDTKGIFSKSTTKPLDRPKATYTAFTGRKSGAHIGMDYTGQSKLIRDGKSYSSVNLLPFHFNSASSGFFQPSRRSSARKARESRTVRNR